MSDISDKDDEELNDSPTEFDGGQIRAAAAIYAGKIEQQFLDPLGTDNSDVVSEALTEFIEVPVSEPEDIYPALQDVSTEIRSHVEQFMSDVNRIVENHTGLTFDKNDSSFGMDTIHSAYLLMGPNAASNVIAHVAVVDGLDNVVIKREDDIEAILTNSDVTNLETFLENIEVTDPDDEVANRIRELNSMGTVGSNPDQFCQYLMKFQSKVYERYSEKLSEETISEAENEA